MFRELRIAEPELLSYRYSHNYQDENRDDLELYEGNS